ncbi:hypothetical protein Pla52o_02240 [Novipirellula galeiformis]|uniref:Cytochrome c domain-containing protein n=1 Tax=Novipirellula galeiformis TaxID=2528004 RepID=A0A5C6CSH4_9BACT|nr:hypothetical protein [Novipirellula galeiformis]TWU26371.1 hypothetical protein Pla52o_02240 [Novipirellula galeiformis]
MNPTCRLSLASALATLLGLLASNVASAQLNLRFEVEKPPFEYSETEPNNRVSRLIAKLKSKELKLEYTRERGYLASLLDALEIPQSSQTLVFSKTSMQVRHISPRNPRAIYFNDDTYLGWIRGSSLMEISTVDPKLGAAFYTVDMMPWRAKIEQATYDCLACHLTSMTQGVPGHTVRSVLPSFDGSVASQLESFITNHRSPFSQRWGGWYVTGHHGEMTHLGNSFLRGGQLDTDNNGNRTHLRDKFDTHDYLLPYSDIVALVVLEHQSQTHNAMTRADFSVRQLRHERSQAEATEESEDEWRAQLHLIAKPLVEAMLFCDETELTSEVKGSIEFAHEFESRGPHDEQGRSLRQFDLKTRMFKYPLSYLIYSDAFDSLSEELRGEVIRQLRDVLEERDTSETYAHLTTDMRRDILEILRATKPGFERDAS